jgi:hypothetical protein
MMQRIPAALAVLFIATQALGGTGVKGTLSAKFCL